MVISKSWSISEEHSTSLGERLEIITCRETGDTHVYIDNNNPDTGYVCIGHGADKRTALTDAANRLRLAADLLGNWPASENPDSH